MLFTFLVVMAGIIHLSYREWIEWLWIGISLTIISWCMIMKHVIALASVSASTFTAYAKAQWSRSRTTSIWVGNCSMSEALSDEHVRSLCLGTAIAKRRLASVFDILRIRQEWAVRFHAPCAWLDSLVSSYDYSKSNLPLRTWFILRVF